MQELTVIGVDDGALIAADARGDRFRLAVDDVLLSQVRRARRAHEAQGPKLSPREIQSQIRQGLSAEDVAELLGADVDDIRRFEGPVLAEREHVVGAAHAVPVNVELGGRDGQNPTFGAAIRQRLDALGALGERWTSWKDPDAGWIVKLTFSAAGVDHDARWAFEPRRGALSPMSTEAITLSTQGQMPASMIPRLRAVDADLPSEKPSETVIDTTPAPRQSSLPSAARAAVNRGPAGRDDRPSPTADLLEALRRRRGERERAPLPEIAPDNSPAAEQPAAAPRDSAAPADQPARPTKRGRTAMPSWDEIVFGARSDDE